MICTITVLNVKTCKLESQVIKDDNIHPNKVLLKLNDLITSLNKESENLIVINVNVSFVDIIEGKIVNNYRIEFND